MLKVFFLFPWVYIFPFSIFLNSGLLKSSTCVVYSQYENMEKTRRILRFCLPIHQKKRKKLISILHVKSKRKKLKKSEVY